ncbi:MAG: hypothetical protein Q8J69_08625 [Sphingobacteriaceae bacterium]|nr:hypothetical protein [Sphingobacteriaceae bacterium]
MKKTFLKMKNHPMDVFHRNVLTDRLAMACTPTNKIKLPEPNLMAISEEEIQKLRVDKYILIFP